MFLPTFGGLGNPKTDFGDGEIKSSGAQAAIL